MASFKVLVVDDEPGIREGVKRILRNFTVDYPFMDERVEYQLEEAETGRQGIQMIENNMPDILLLDNKLPDIEGIEVLEYIKQHKFDIVVVMITSYASLDLAVKATTDGAIDFIPKPFTPQELRASLENITKQLYLKRMTSTLNSTGKQIRFRFLSVLSHELKAPLNAIEGYLLMMKEKELGNQIEKYEQPIERSLERIKGMRQLILDLLDITKIESGKPTQKIEPVNLFQVIRTTLDTIRPYAIQKEVNLFMEVDPKLEMMADRGEIEIILNNLLSNAVKYNVKDGTVACHAYRSGNRFTLVVSDTGIGMAPDDIHRIFDDFVRLKQPEAKDVSGSGLGLSIVRKIVDMYQGQVKVESDPGKGSIFTITLAEAAKPL